MLTPNLARCDAMSGVSSSFGKLALKQVFTPQNRIRPAFVARWPSAETETKPSAPAGTVESPERSIAVTVASFHGIVKSKKESPVGAPAGPPDETHATSTNVDNVVINDTIIQLRIVCSSVYNYMDTL
jgi:hypothetical protein